MENPIRMDDLGAPPFKETSISNISNLPSNLEDSGARLFGSPITREN